MADRNTLAVAFDWARRGHKVALATVVSTRGSAPRPVGARLAIDDTGRFCGSVSSGCVEAEVIATAENVIATGAPVLRAFGPSDSLFAAALTCGGVIRIFVEPLTDPLSLERRLARARSGEESATLLDPETGARVEAQEACKTWEGTGRRLLLGALRAQKDALIETASGAFFLEFWRAPLRLAIVGATHIAQTLAPLCALADYEVTVIDPRSAFATPERFPGQSVVTLAPEDYFAQSPPDQRTAVVALSHEARFDDPALIAALRGGAFYVGALGSHVSARKRRLRLRARGVDEAALARLSSPVGLAIGARTPAEIAIAIAAEMTQALRQASPAAIPGESRIAAVVLAAGQSRRMGQNKLLLPLDGKPVIRHVLDALASAPLAETLVVIGHEASRLRAALKEARLVTNPRFASGLASSLQAGVAALDDGIDGAMIVLGDMPDVAPSLIARMIKVFSAQGAEARRKIIAPTHEGRRGHPVLWGRDFFPALLHETDGDGGARDLIERHAKALITVETASDAILNDLDTPQAYSRRRSTGRR